MNVKISFTHKLLAGFWILDRTEFNYYTIDLDMITASDVLDQNIAFLRIRHILESTLADVVFVNYEETDAIDALNLAGIPVAYTPDDPVDQIIGMLLHAKLNAVTEGKLIVKRVRLSSIKGDSIVYEHDDSELNPFYSSSGEWGNSWWVNLDPDDTSTIFESDEVSIITANRHWRELGLSWVSADNNDATGDVVVFGDFKKNED